MPKDEIALVLNSGNSIRLFTAKCYVGDGIVGDAPIANYVDADGIPNGRQSTRTGQDRWIGDWYGGSISLNGTGVTQAAPDFPLLLHTVTSNHTDGGKAVRAALYPSENIDMSIMSISFQPVSAYMPV